MNNMYALGSAFQLHTIDDIPGDVLAAPGLALREFFPAGREYAVTGHLSDALREIPSTGWRMIDKSGSDGQPREAIAAPSIAAPGTWIVIYSSLSDEGQWVISTGGEGWTFPAVPVRSERRRKLQLELGETTAPAGTMPRIHPTLSNTGDTTWRNVANDTPTVLVWICDTDGKPITAPGLTYTGSSGTLPDLQPGETVGLYAADFRTPDVEQFAPGIYTLTGILKDLSLRSEPGTLHIT